MRGNNHQFAWIEDEKTNLKYIGLPPQKKQFSFNLGLKVILLVINKFTFKKCLCDCCTDFVKMVYMFFNSGSCNPVSCANPQLCWNISIQGISPSRGYLHVWDTEISPCREYPHVGDTRLYKKYDRWQQLLKLSYYDCVNSKGNIEQGQSKNNLTQVSRKSIYL